jgi:nickel/cobalt exporter
MTGFASLLQQGVGQAWLFLPTAVMLGALHALEPGHSKSMMASFIVAIRGTYWQAALLAVSATVSHTAIVWAVAILGLTYGSRWSVETTEPYFQLASGILIVAITAWMAYRAWRDRHGAGFRSPFGHGHGHDHDHDHDHDHGHDHGHGHPHPHRHEGAHGAGEDAHARAHAQEIRKRFAGRHVTTGQIVMFGLTGGLLPCPAAVTVLLLCLQLKHFGLGLALVLAFSIGLALTLLASGMAAAWGVHHAAKRWLGLDGALAKAPYLAGAIIAALGLYVGYAGFMRLA